MPWDRPWLPQVAAWLAREWQGRGPLDLCRVLAVVPTRQAGRRLREALAEHASARSTAVFPPRTLTPDTLLAEGAAGPGVATRLEALLAWVDVLREVELEAVAAVLPVAPPRRDFAWAWRLAEMLFRLQTQLSEGGLGLEEVVACAGDLPDEERWRQLAALERRQTARLAAAGRREPHAARRAYARESNPPAGIERIVLLAVPDPLPLALEMLGRWARSVPIDVVVHAPPEESDAFDSAGRPLPSVWASRAPTWPEFEERVQLCADPADEAERVAEVAGAYAQPDGLLAIGIADAEVRSPLERELARSEIASFNPEGRARKEEGLSVLLAALALLARGPTYEAVAALARCPDFLAALRLRSGEGGAADRVLAELDAVRGRQLPADLAALRRCVSKDEVHLMPALDFIDELHRALAGAGFPDGAVGALNLIFADRTFDLAQPAEARAAETLAGWRETLDECTAAAEHFGALAANDWWEVARRRFGEERQAGEKAPGALELQGWLELPWEDAPHLVVAGLNDGLVPESVVGDAFLPEVLRGRLGLKTNAARFARDAYLLQALAAARRSGGRLDLLVAKASLAGDPLRPSRLLLQCDERDLPRRVAFLFRPAEATRRGHPWTRAWRLSPRRVPPPPRVPVTGLKAWLACPFRFYLQYALRLEAVDPEKTELDARDFGTLCHAALEAMAREPGLRDCTDEAQLGEFLLGQFDRSARRQLAGDFSLPVLAQLESARQRLARAAVVQARERAAGWRVERVEWPFAVELGGLEVRGRIDRVDRHVETGAWRVLDYKTSDRATPPHLAHLRRLRAADRGLPGWRQTEIGDGARIWVDLQLPLYLRALAAETGGVAPLTVGYFNLPKAAGETAVVPWPELQGELLESAWTCAEEVGAAIRRGEFWPPAEQVAGRDAFASWFHHGAAESVAWEVAR
ncbi:MAG: ATP-dependent nuclease subunit B [Verrucomicrobia bacterium]|nr:ATP-dependent nuclease subunit B [Verrucomicrobiota bacterium]